MKQNTYLYEYAGPDFIFKVHNLKYKGRTVCVQFLEGFRMWHASLLYKRTFYHGYSNSSPHKAVDKVLRIVKQVEEQEKSQPCEKTPQL